MYEINPAMLRSLDELADTNPETLSSTTAQNFRFRYVDLGATSAGSIHWKSVAEVSYATSPSRARRVLRYGDVLFGTVRPNLQSHGYFDRENIGAVVASTGFSVIRAKEGVSDSRYLFHCVMSSQISIQANRDAVGSSYPALNDGDVRRFEIFAPPIAEQTVIAKIVDTLDTSIRQTEAIIEKLKLVKQGMLHDLLTRGIDANGELRPLQSQAPHLYKDSPLGWIPNDWNAIQFSALAEYMNGNTFDAGDWRTQGLPIIRIQNLNGSKSFNYFVGVVDSRWQVRHGDLLFAWSGQRGVSFGPRIWSGPEGVLNQHIFKVIEKNDVVSKEFLFEILRFRQSVIEDSAHGFKDSFLHVTRGELGAVFAGVPLPEEQSMIVSRIATFESQLIAENTNLAKNMTLKAGLLDDLLTGRVRVTPLLDSIDV